MGSRLRTSFIIPTRNRAQLLSSAVEAILQSTQPPNELIVCDQSDEPHPIWSERKGDRHCEIRYLWMRTIGASQARNAGIAAARYEILAFVDDDVLISPTWTEVTMRVLTDKGSLAVVRGQILPSIGDALDRFTPSIKIDPVPAMYEGQIEKDVLSGAAMTLYRSAFDRVGGFDERLGAGGKFAAAEDNDLGFRLLEAGYRIYHVPDAIVRHVTWRGMDQYAALCWSYGYGQGAYYVKHLNWKDGHMLRRMASDIGERIRSFPRHFLRNPRQAFGDLSYTVGLLKGGIGWLAERSDSSSGPRRFDRV